MVKINNILIIGVGAIGSIYATKFYDNNRKCLKILIDEPRFERYKNNGIVFNGFRYDFDYILPSETDYKADLIIIATKSNDFLYAVEMIKNFVKEDTIIMSLLNGISSEPVLINNFGQEKVLYSYFIGHASINQNNRISHDGVGKIVFGECQNTELSENVLRVKELFERVKIDYEIPEDMLSSMWLKFAMNVGINQASAIFNADYKALQESKCAKRFVIELMEEAVAVANKMGINNTDTFINTTIELINNMPKDAKSSMLQDVQNKKRTEVDVFAGEICRLGKIYNIQTPKNEFVLDKMSSVETLELVL